MFIPAIVVIIVYLLVKAMRGDPKNEFSCESAIIVGLIVFVIFMLSMCGASY